MATCTPTFSPLFAAIIAFSKVRQQPTPDSVEACETLDKALLEAWQAIYALDKAAAQALQDELQHRHAQICERASAIEDERQEAEKLDLNEKADRWLKRVLANKEDIRLIEGTGPFEEDDAYFEAISRAFHRTIPLGDAATARRLLTILGVCFPTNTSMMRAIYEMVFERGAQVRVVVPGFVEILE